MHYRPDFKTIVIQSKVDFLGHFTQATMLFQFQDIENKHIKANINSSASFDINYLNSAKIPKCLLQYPKDTASAILQTIPPEEQTIKIPN